MLSDTEHTNLYEHFAPASARFKIFILHSTIPMDEQEQDRIWGKACRSCSNVAFALWQRLGLEDLLLQQVLYNMLGIYACTFCG